MRIFELGYQLVNESINDNQVTVKNISISDAEKILKKEKMSGKIVKACAFVYNMQKDFLVYVFLDDKGQVRVLQATGKIPSILLTTISEFKRSMEELPKNMRSGKWDNLIKNIIKATMIANGQLIYYKKRKK